MAIPRVHTYSPIPMPPAAQKALFAATLDVPIATHGRGEQYFRQRRVLELSQEGDAIEGLVRGSSLYTTSWRIEFGKWTSRCSCPVGRNCKHAVAVALAALTVARSPEEYLLAQAASRQADSSPVDPAEAFAALTSEWDRRQVVKQLLSPAEFKKVSAYDPRIEAVLDEPNAELLCHRLAVVIATLSGGPIPQALLPYADRRDLAAELAEREATRHAAELLRWVAARKVSPTHSLRFVWGFLEDRRRGPLLTVKACLTSPRFNDERRSHQQLRQLRQELERKPGMLSDDDLLLLDAYFEAVTRYSYATFMPGDWIHPMVAIAMIKAVDPLPSPMVWEELIPEDVAASSGIQAGAPLSLSKTYSRILPTVAETPLGARIEMACVFGDGRIKPLREVLWYPNSGHNRFPGVVISGGEFFLVNEEPPPHIYNRFLQGGGLEVPRAHCARVIAPLARHLDHVSGVLGAHTRLVSGRAVVSLDLRDDDWLQIRVFVCSAGDDWLPHSPPPNDAIVVEYAPDQSWRRAATGGSAASPAYDAIDRATTGDLGILAPPTASPQVSDADAWIEEPDQEIAEPALSWLSAIRAEPGTKGRPGGNAPVAPDLHIGWWVQASAKRMETLAEVWAARPSGVRFVGTERIRRLLAGEQVVRPKIKVTASGLDWFAVAAAWESEGLALSDDDMAKLRNATTRFVKLPTGWVRRDAVEAHDEAAGALADLGVEIGGGEQRITLWQLAGAKEESLAALEGMAAGREALTALKTLRRKLRAFKGVPEVRVPSAITAELRPYQQRGLDFLVYTSSLGIGAILADDMGLGKTLQALAWLQYLVGQDRKGRPSLVVCPTSVVHNWAREAAQFAPKLRVLVLERGAQRHELRRELSRYDLVITNYALLRIDIEQWREVELRAVILDEAQNIKNPDAAVTQAARQLLAKHRLALTGTPLENRPLDLWSIASFLNPGYLGTRSDFGVRYDRIDGPPHSRTLLAAKLRPILLRRLKRDVARDLPERIEERRDCELTDGQRQLYLAELRRSRKLVDELAEDVGGLRKNKIAILAALTRLRQICCHPALAKGKQSLGSGKFDTLFELLEPLIEEGHKVLVFSQFVECLKLLGTEMTARGIPHHKLTGQTTRRMEVVEAFQSDPNPCVFLISLKAGGTGLNLTAASYVVLFDPWWNPAAEAQAIDRTHRIGQDRTVIAYRMIARGTIEEKIWELQQRKAAMVKDILGEDGFARSLSRDDLGFLLQEA